MTHFAKSGIISASPDVEGLTEMMRLPSEQDAALPRSFLACLPVLWSHVLFPGASPSREPIRWHHFLSLLILPALLLYPVLGFALFEPDEGRYAEIPREMLDRGEWVVPYLQGEPYLDKPPLLYWLVMLSYRIFGIDDWSARLVPALALHLGILTTYLLGRRSLGERAAFWGALLLSLAPGFMSMGRLLLLDGLLTLWTTLALLCAHEALRGERLAWGWWLLSAVVTGLGVLTKGPVILILLVPPLWLNGWLNSRPRRVTRFALAAFIGITLVLALPWYVALMVRLPEFGGYFFWEHNVVRFVSGFDHIRPVWFYGPVLLLGLLPATLFAIPFIRFLLSGNSEVASHRCPDLGFMLLAGGWCVFFFSLSGCKLPTYILPAFPFLALAFGCMLADGKWLTSRLPGVVAGTAFVLLFVAHNFALPWYAEYRSPMHRIHLMTAYCGDRSTPVLCYPRPCDSVSFYLRRDDIRNIRSKDIEELRAALREQPRTVVLCTHRHSVEGLRDALPPEVCVKGAVRIALPRLRWLPEGVADQVTQLAGETALGLSDLVVIERR